jgi:hypothetical protein
VRNIRHSVGTIATKGLYLLGAYKPFDPLIQSSANVNRLSYSGYTQLQGVGENSNAALNTLSQTVQASYTRATGSLLEPYHVQIAELSH